MSALALEQVVEHDTWLTTEHDDQAETGYAYRPVCSCGWLAPDALADPDHASDVATEHEGAAA